MKYFLASLFASRWYFGLLLEGFAPPFWFLFSKYGGWWGWLFHIVTFGVAWFCVHQFIHKKLWGSFVATIVISTNSVLFHIALIFSGLMVPYFWKTDTIFSSLMQMPLLFGAVISVFTESCVALLFYKIVDKKRMVMWLVIATVLNMGIGLSIRGKIKMAGEKRWQDITMKAKERLERRRLEKHRPKVIKKR